MNLTHRLVGAWKVLRGGVPAVKNQAPAYEAAGFGRRARGWLAPPVGPNDALLGNLETLRARSRAGVRNDGYARACIDRMVSNIVGCGMTPESQAPDPAFRAEIHRKFLDWTDEADADGVCDFFGLQALAVRSWLEGGEGFTRLRSRLQVDGLTVPLQLQMIEAEHCPVSLTFQNADRSVRAGIEVDGIGRKTFYHIYRSRPVEGSDLDTTRLVRVPAESMIHLYDELRPGQLRGAPTLTQTLIKLYELDLYQDATVERQKVAALFAGFIEKGAVLPGEEDLDPLTRKPIVRDEHDTAIIGLEPGLVNELGPGEKITFADPPDSAGFGDFLRNALMGAAVSAGVPYEVLTGDLRAVNDRTVRVILNEFRRSIEMKQHHVLAFQWNRRVWEAWFDRAVISGALNPPAEYFIDPLPWRRVEWIPAAWPYLHPVQDIQAYREAIRAGVMTLGEAVKEIRGRNLEEVLRERKDELTLLDSLGIITDSDPRNTAGSGQPTVERDPAPVPAPGPSNLDRALIHALTREPAPPADVNVKVDAPHITVEPPRVHVGTSIDQRPNGRKVIKDVERDPVTHRITRIRENIEREEAVPQEIVKNVERDPVTGRIIRVTETTEGVR